ncbi:MAG: ATP-dependent helicase HrpB [Candidatus Wallbacteria bacterium]|nr:ATP-dependent helicase HrpB [Candidatus Wallbacteria bacterium]
MKQQPLPIDEHLEEIVRTLRASRHAVIVAPPGSGKTTRVPAALLCFGRVILLQPRRVAARSLARRIATERGWALGEEVGWQVRFERRFGPATRLLVATEGILTARLQADPLLSEFAVAVIDEFHERSLHADLALAMAREAAAARDDLRLVVMSATLDAAPVAEFLGSCPIVQIPGRPHPVEIRHAPEMSPAAAVRELLLREPSEPGPGSGHVLVFFPGAPEIRRAAGELVERPAAVVGDPRSARPFTVLPLHGSLDAAAQDEALAPSPVRKVILATNLAETSLTIDGVTDVIDSGFHKVLRYDPASGLDRLETERISLDSAEQRAGRAGRTGPGRVLRLWDSRLTLREHREPEIARVDLAEPFLEVLAWGGDPLRFPWYQQPGPERAHAALVLLEALGALTDGRITPLGRALRRFPLHPRLARVLLEARGARLAAAACAVLAEGWVPKGAGDVATDSDVLLRIGQMGSAPWAVRRAADELAALAGRVLDSEESTRSAGSPSEESLLRALLAGFPDRVARRREPGAPRLLLYGGQGAVLGRECGVRDGDWLLALDVMAAPRGAGPEAIVRTASRIERTWLCSTARGTEHVFDSATGKVRALERTRYGALVLSEHPVTPNPIEASRLLAEALRSRGLGEPELSLRRRIRFAGLAFDEDAWIAAACEGRTSLSDVDLPNALPRALLRQLDRLAPEAIPIPSGREARLEYREDGTVSASVKLQELFGLAETPRIGPARVPVTLVLLAPSGRPVQTTRDLRSFWDSGYPEVRKELRGRYPKHPWPEDPWTTPATHRTKPRRR